jgi:hypothetical protein
MVHACVLSPATFILLVELSPSLYSRFALLDPSGPSHAEILSFYLISPSWLRLWLQLRILLWL